VSLCRAPLQVLNHNIDFRDEYIRLADDTASAEKLAKKNLTIEEFFKRKLLRVKSVRTI
jgi:hypothetical protein